MSPMTNTQRKSQISAIKDSLDDMLNELSDKELDLLVDFIVNFCEDSYEDEDGNSPNIFRMVLDDQN
jgi:hypothetical protein